MTSLVFKNISKDYGSRRVLQDISFALKPGDLAMVVGANGSGKSTLLRMAASLSAPSAGSIVYNNQPAALWSTAALHTHIGYLSHEIPVIPEATVAENAYFYGRLHGFDAKTSHNESARWIEKLELQPVAQRLARTLSRGFLQRLGLIHALLHRPALLVLDEPYTALDAHTQTLLTGILTEAQAAESIILCSTHDTRVLAPLATAIFSIQKGKLLVS